MGKLRMTVDGRQVETLYRFAELRGVDARTVRATWARADPRPEPADHVDSRTAVYFLDDLELMYRPRPKRTRAATRK